MDIRLARRSDAAAIARLSRTEIEHGLRWSWRPARVLSMLRNPEATVIVAESGGNLAGFAIMTFGSEEAHLHLLATAPQSRRQGTASALLNWLLTSCSIAGMLRVNLEVRRSNQGAQRFYEQLGFRSSSVRKGYYQGVEDARVMVRDMTASAPAPVNTRQERIEWPSGRLKRLPLRHRRGDDDNP